MNLKERKKMKEWGWIDWGVRWGGKPVGCWPEVLGGWVMGGFGWQKVNLLRGIFISSSIYFV